MAKAQFRSGNTDDAMIAAKQANDLDENIRQIAVCVKAWHERAMVQAKVESGDESKAGIEKVVGKVQKHVDRIRDKQGAAAGGSGSGAKASLSKNDAVVVPTTTNNNAEDALKQTKVVASAKAKKDVQPGPEPGEVDDNVGEGKAVFEEQDSFSYKPIGMSSQDSFGRAMSPSQTTFLGDDEFTFASQTYGSDIHSDSFRITQGTGGRKRRNNTKRISDFVSSQLKVELMERKRRKKKEIEVRRVGARSEPTKAATGARNEATKRRSTANMSAFSACCLLSSSLRLSLRWLFHSSFHSSLRS